MSAGEDMKEYIVIAHRDSDLEKFREFLKNLKVLVLEDFDGLPHTFNIEANKEQLDQLMNNKDVKLIESANIEIKQFNKYDEVGNLIQKGKIRKKNFSLESNIQTLTGKDNWGLGRIDSRNRDSDNTYSYNKLGSNVDVYVIDSGVRSTHVEFDNRVSDLWSGYDDFDDYTGHGTHVASIVGGKRFGVAKNCNIINVKVFDKSNFTSLKTIVSGCNAVLSHHKEKISKGRNIPSVVNMSLGGDGYSINEIVNEMHENGMVICAAAGNNGQELDTQIDVYPAESEDVLTVNSLNENDEPSFFNNYGIECDIFAPGESIIAAGNENDDEWKRMSGTSMATPFVSGVCAMLLEGKNIYDNRNDAHNLYELILNKATKNYIEFSGIWNQRKNKLPKVFLYSNIENNNETVAPEKSEENNKSKYIIFGVGAVVILAILGFIFI